MSYKTQPLQSDLLSDSRENIRRIKTDNSLTSFDDNRQFRFFDRIFFPDTTNYQLVYKVSFSSDINLLSRIISLYIGGLSYSIYPCDCSAIFTGNLVDVTATKVFPNNTVLRDGFSAHPATLNKFERAEGVSIFDSNDAIEVFGAEVFAGNNQNFSRTALDSENLAAGYAKSGDVWLVFNELPETNTDSKGTFTLLWEEL